MVFRASHSLTRSRSLSRIDLDVAQAEHLTMIDSKLFQAIKASDLLGCQWQKDASSPLSIISTVREPPLRTHSPSRAHIHTPAFNLKLQERLLSRSSAIVHRAHHHLAHPIDSFSFGLASYFLRCSLSLAIIHRGSIESATGS